MLFLASLGIALGLLNFKVINYFSEGEAAKPLTTVLTTTLMLLVTFHDREPSFMSFIELMAWNLVYIIAYVDLLTYTIVDALIYGAGLLFIVVALMSGATVTTTLYGALVGAAFYGLIYLLAKAYYGKEAFGFGDVMLMAALGTWLGPGKTVIIGFLAFYFALLGLLAHKLKGKSLTMETAIAFGPYICLAGWVMSLWGDYLINWYFQTFLF